MEPSQDRKKTAQNALLDMDSKMVNVNNVMMSIAKNAIKILKNVKSVKTDTEKTNKEVVRFVKTDTEKMNKKAVRFAKTLTVFYVKTIIKSVHNAQIIMV